MKHLRLSLVTFTLMLALSLSALAGEIQTGITPPSPPVAGEIQTPIASEIALSLVQSILTLF
jgi:hypothetical protein